LREVFFRTSFDFIVRTHIIVFDTVVVRSNIRTFTAEGAAQALDLLAREAIDIIVTDFRMPDKNGMELLREVVRLYPSVSRIIFSGFVDHEILLRSLSSGGSFHCSIPSMA
jgi:DNA-binding NarL/FixJ family response regulator